MSPACRNTPEEGGALTHIAKKHWTSHTNRHYLQSGMYVFKQVCVLRRKPPLVSERRVSKNHNFDSSHGEIIAFGVINRAVCSFGQDI